MTPPPTPRNTPLITRLTRLTACLGLACLGCTASPSLDEIDDRVRAIDARVATELDLPVDKRTNQDLEGGPSCQTGGCPGISSYYTLDTPYDPQQCETWADALRDLGWGHGSPDGYVDERPTIYDRGQPGEPACQVDANHAALHESVVIDSYYIDADTCGISMTSYWLI